MDNTHKRFQNISMQVKLITKNKPEPQIFQNLSVIKPTFFFHFLFRHEFTDEWVRTGRTSPPTLALCRFTFFSSSGSGGIG